MPGPHLSATTRPGREARARRVVETLRRLGYRLAIGPEGTVQCLRGGRCPRADPGLLRELGTLRVEALALLRAEAAPPLAGALAEVMRRCRARSRGPPREFDARIAA